MIVLALTGSMAMGKSTIARYLRTLKIPVNDADKIVHDLLENNLNVIDKVKKKFPHAYINEKISRKILAEDLEKEPQKLKALEDILHPEVQKRTFSFIQKHQRMRTPFICLDIPLLFEKKIDENSLYSISYIILASASKAIQEARLKLRPLSPKLAQYLLKNQLPDKIKREKADFIVETGLSKAYTFKQIREILNRLKD